MNDLQKFLTEIKNIQNSDEKIIVIEAETEIKDDDNITGGQ